MNHAARIHHLRQYCVNYDDGYRTLCDYHSSTRARKLKGAWAEKNAQAGSFSQNQPQTGRFSQIGKLKEFRPKYAQKTPRFWDCFRGGPEAGRFLGIFFWRVCGGKRFWIMADVIFLGLVRAGLRRERVLRERNNPLEWREEDLQARIHISRATFMRVLGIIQPRLQRPTNRARALPVTTQAYVALKFYASGSFQLDVGDLSGVHQTTAGVWIHAVSQVLADRLDTYVKFPATDAELEEVRNGFFSIAGDWKYIYYILLAK